MRYQRITTYWLLQEIQDISFALGRLWSVDVGAANHARSELETVRQRFKEELLARMSRKRRRR